MRPLNICLGYFARFLCLTTVFLGVACAVPDPNMLAGDPSQPQCGFVVVEPPLQKPVNPCLPGPDVVTVFGPTTFPRAKGSPRAKTNQFTLPADGTICLRVQNEDRSKGTRIASATLAVDGTVVIGPERFNNTVMRIEEKLDLGAGDHVLGVRLASTPSSFITVEIGFAAPPSTSPFHPIPGDNGQIVIFDLLDEPDPFSPNGDGVKDKVALSANVTVSALPGAPSSQFDHVLKYQFEIAGGASCGSVRALSGQLQVKSKDTTLSISSLWDGRGWGSSTLTDGTYFYRVVVTYLRQHKGNGNEELLDEVYSQVQSVTIDATAPLSTQPGRFAAAAADVAKIQALLDTPALKSKATPAPPPSSNPIVAEVQRRLGDLFVQHSKYGTVRLLLSPRITIPVGSVGSSTPYEKAATTFFADYPGLLALDPTHDVLTLESVDQHPQGATVRFSQAHAGAPCRGAFVTVLLDKARRVRGFLSQLLPLGSRPATPKVAVSTKAMLLPGDVAAGAPMLHFIDRPEWREARLAWKVPATDARGRAVDYWVDAETGATIAREVQADEAVTWNRVLYDKPFSSERKVREETPFYCDYCTPKTTPCTCVFLNPGEEACWDATDAVATYLDGRGHTSWDTDNQGKGLSMQINIEDDTLSGNGEWDRVSQWVNIHPNCATAKELVAHEWGHAVANKIDFAIGEPRALSEGFADCFAMMVYDNNWQWNESAPPLCGAGTRDARWALNGGYRNRQVGYPHQNGQVVSHICYLTSFLTSAQPGPFSCTVGIPWDCPGFWFDPFRVDCVDFGFLGLGNRCVSWSNAVPVPYHGRNQGYGPIFKTITEETGYKYLGSTSDFEHLVGALTLAGCTYDALELGQPVCSVMGLTNFLASLAAGIWFSPLFVHHHDASGDVSINTDRRPAFIQNAKAGTTYNWAATFYREGRTTDHAKLKYTYDGGDPHGTVETPQLVLAQGNPVLAGSGLSAVRDPYGLAPGVGLFFKADSSNSLQYMTGTLGPSSITWAAPHTVTAVQTDRAPEAVNYKNALWYIWKEAKGTQIWAMIHGNPSGNPIDAGGTFIDSESAPTAVVAAGRLWVFYRDYSTDHIHFTSTSGGEWTSPGQLSDHIYTDWDPEAIYYQPVGGLRGDGRIWVFYRRPYDNSQADEEEGTRMVSMKPQDIGTVTDISPPVFLYQTRLPSFPYEPYHAAFQWWVTLRLYHPREEAGQDVDGVWPMWKIEKIGEG